MKKFVSILTFTLLVSYANGQNEDRVFKPFRVDINLGVPIQTGSGFKEGLSISVEPKYSINDQIQLGLRMESAAMAKVVEYPNSSSTNATIIGNGSYSATADYYFNLNKFRPFAGIGLGICRLASYNINFDVTNEEFAIASERKFECMLRTGFEFGHGRLAFEYNYIPKTTATTDQNSTIIIRNSYFNLKLGIAIGGGRLKR